MERFGYKVSSASKTPVIPAILKVADVIVAREGSIWGSAYTRSVRCISHCARGVTANVKVFIANMDNVTPVPAPRRDLLLAVSKVREVRRVCGLHVRDW